LWEGLLEHGILYKYEAKKNVLREKVLPQYGNTVDISHIND